MTTKARISQFCSYIVLIFNVTAGALYFGAENLTAIVQLLAGYNVTSRPLPVRIQLPFDAEQSPIYELLVIVLFLHSMTLVFPVNLLSGLVFSLVFHACGQIDIICQELKNISEKMSHYGSSTYTTGMLIERHNRVISFSKNIDKVFSFIALMQILGNTLVICFLGLVLMTSHTDIDIGLLKTMFAYMGISLEVFVVCFVGEYLCIKSKSLGDAAYESLWYNMSPSHVKKLLLIIMRSQKQLTITAGGITNLSLESFTSIMKASASYMSVLKAMY
ncbi:odorant receptor 22c-like isoform X1 [Harpegnathos saltator]|uniref:odorant receptor 22c-like isoform X1 n=1 Tax=Harpegnathos saltator TaxID=610380 RepID=UPI000DBEE050|nr:odorant receptor 22c-like isoform X1 [Harpegnathos saltator]